MVSVCLDLLYASACLLADSLLKVMNGPNRSNRCAISVCSVCPEERWQKAPDLFCIIISFFFFRSKSNQPNAMAYQGRINKYLCKMTSLSIRASVRRPDIMLFLVEILCVLADVAVSNKTKMTDVFLHVVVYRLIRTEMYQPRKPCEGLLEFFGIGLLTVFDATSWRVGKVVRNYRVCMGIRWQITFTN